MMLDAFRWLIAIAAAMLTGIFCGITGSLDPSRRVPLFLNRLFAKLFLPVTGIKLAVSGCNTLNLKTNYILCSNHQGLFDIFTLMAAIPLPLRFVSKPSYFKIPLIGWGMRGSGHIEITRTDKEKDRRTLDQLALLVREGASIVMFPEGTRTRDGTIGPFKYGAFHVSCQSGIPILPVTIRGSFEKMRKGKLLPVPGTIEVIFHPPIHPSGCTVESLMQKTREAIVSIF